VVDIGIVAEHNIDIVVAEHKFVDIARNFGKVKK
jgi:hypothetical protein